MTMTNDWPGVGTPLGSWAPGLDWYAGRRSLVSGDTRAEVWSVERRGVNRDQGTGTIIWCSSVVSVSHPKLYLNPISRREHG